MSRQVQSIEPIYAKRIQVIYPATGMVADGQYGIKVDYWRRIRNEEYCCRLQDHQGTDLGHRYYNLLRGMSTNPPAGQERYRAITSA